jgi:hypothetical protein
MIEGKGLGGKKPARKNVYLSNEYEKKLNMLATSCGKKPGELARMILERALDDSMTVNELQNEYCLYAAYRVRLVKDYKTEKLDYVLYDNEREDFK